MILRLCFFFIVFFFSFCNSLSNIDLIFLVNINSAGDNPDLVLEFGITRYTLKICRVSLTDPFASDF